MSICEREFNSTVVRHGLLFHFLFLALFLLSGRVKTLPEAEEAVH